MPLHMYIYFTSLRFLLIRVQKHPNQVQICHLEEASKADLLNICVFFLDRHTEKNKI